MKLILLLSSLAIAEGRFFDWNYSHHGHGHDDESHRHGDEDGGYRHGHGHGHHGNGNTNQDACSSAVAGVNGRPGIIVRESDCSNFLTETVTPETITITTTSTINSLPPSMQSLTIPASELGGSTDPIPTYAISACSDNPLLYSSACSILGITDMDTITAEIPTATVVSFVSFRPTAQPTAVPTTTTSMIHAASSSAIAVTSYYTYLGCYTEANDMNPLNGPTLVNYVSMTYAECFSFCTPTYPLCGLGNGGECFCGTALNPGSMSVASSDCYTPCAGDASETCGASNRFSIFGTAAAASKISSIVVVSTRSKAVTSNLEIAISSKISTFLLPSSSVTSSSSETTLSSTSLSTSSSMSAAESSSSQSSSTSISSTSSITPAESLPSLFISSALSLSTSSITTSLSATQTSSVQSSFITFSSSPSSLSISSSVSSSTTSTTFIIPALPSTSTSSAASSSNTTAPNILNRCNDPVSCTTTTACSEDHTCLCQPSVNGIGYCLADTPCSSLMDCNADADCGAGSACMVTCCSSNKCLDSEFLCPNQDTPARLFRKGGLGAGVGVARAEGVEEWTNHLPEGGMSSPPRGLEGEEFVRRWGGGV